jgi:hypothetical protein
MIDHFPLTLTLSPQGRGEAIHPPSRAGRYSTGIFINWNKNEGVTHFVKWQRKSLIDTEVPPC